MLKLPPLSNQWALWQGHWDPTQSAQQAACSRICNI